LNTKGDAKGYLNPPGLRASVGTVATPEYQGNKMNNQPNINQSDYDHLYYKCHCGSLPYDRSEPHWMNFFGNIAQKINETLKPKRVFDAGCAIGFLVETLRRTGVEAFGRDFSRFAIDQVPAELKPFCECGSLADPIVECYDLVTCIEVLEHMTPDDGAQAIANMCAAAPVVLVSSTPTDLTEPTHVNVQPPLYWLRLFAQSNFGPRAAYDPSYICPWAMLLERREVPPSEAELEAYAGTVAARMKLAENEQAFQRLQQSTIADLNAAHSHEIERSTAQSEQSRLDLLAAVEKERAELTADMEQIERTAGDLRKRLDQIEASAFWRISHPVRAIFKRYPGLRLALLRSARLSRSMVTGQLLQHWRDLRPSADEALIRASGLFDEAWYVEQYPDSAAFPGGPLRSFMLHGAAEMRNPNPYFNVGWYLEQRPDAIGHEFNPLVHYIRVGAAENAQPSPDFDPGWYLTHYPDIAVVGIEPLSHFLRYGRAEGRLPKPATVTRSVTRAPLVRLKAPELGKDVALFVTHAPGGEIKPHVRPYLEALRREGIAATLIVATDHVYDTQAGHVIDLVDGLYVRQNEGYDFAAWAHVARDIDVMRAEAVYLVNDSLIGPLNASAFAAVVERVRRSPAQLLCLTDNHEGQHHFQSYFLVAKGDGITALDDFLASVTSHSSKGEVISNYELKLLTYFEDKGLAAEALFPTTVRDNETVKRWRQLIERGFPFVKTAALRGNDSDGWQDLLAAQGFDPAIAEASIAVIEKGELQTEKVLPPIVIRDVAEDVAIAVPCGLKNSCPAAPGKIAVICHLFHPHLAVEIWSYLQNIPFDCSLYIVTDTPEKARRIGRIFTDWSKGEVDIRIAPNRGRDIAPKLITFGDAYDRHDFVLHIHSKESSHHPALRHWREYLFSTLIGSPDIVRSIFGAFATAPQVGMIAAQHYEPMRRWVNWGGNFPHADKLARRMGLTLDESAVLDFPSGSMFWARSAALQPLLGLDLSISDFAPEAQQIDGTLAHAIERLYYVSCEKAGLDWVKVGQPEFFSPETPFEAVADGEDFTRFLAQHRYRLLDKRGKTATQAFPEIEQTPAALITAAQRHALGLDRPKPQGRIAVGVVSYNNDQEQLDRCLRSVATGLSETDLIFLWDNGEVSVLAHDMEGRIARFGGQGNLGFGAAHNRLMEMAFAQGAEFYLTANPDGFFHPQAIGRVAQVLAARGGMALVECMQFPVDHPKTFDLTSLRTGWASGAALAIPARIYEAIGGFDDDFFMYCEDVDISWRARAEGFEVAICPSALFVHELTNRQLSDKTLSMIAESGVLLARKWGGRGFARWAARQARQIVEPARVTAPVPAEWRDVADFEHGFSFSETRWS
jgi:lipopolysaccharide biosynthesis protein/GT2 family glycosyltransferase/SAM-dependent methyltransferase